MKKFIIGFIAVVILMIGAGLMFVGVLVGKNNQMVTKNQTVDQKWSQVENVYQRRLDLIPNLVATVKGYANHEMKTLVGVIEQRASATKMTINAADAKEFTEFQKNQAGLSQALGRLMVASENYPNLKADTGFNELRAQLEGTENRISVERDNFNKTVLDYNSYILIFPNSFIADFRGFKARPYFQADKEASKAPKVSFD